MGASDEWTTDPALESLRKSLAGPGVGWVQCPESQADSRRMQTDKGVDFCPLCASDFGMRRKRLHCRVCGVICCKDCSESFPHKDKEALWCLGCKATSVV